MCHPDRASDQAIRQHLGQRPVEAGPIVVGCSDRSGNTSYGATLVLVPRLF